MKVKGNAEARLISHRLTELVHSPVIGAFDREHLFEVHRRIFQDFPEHLPGQLHTFAKAHKKHRVLKELNADYPLIYAMQWELEARLDLALERLKGGQAVVGMTKDELAIFLTDVYAELDYLHPFTEGNSRTLREFTRELAAHAGFDLDWTPHGQSERTRERLYYARDREVLRQAVGGLSEEAAMTARLRGDIDVVNAWVRYDMMATKMPSSDTLLALIRESLGLSPPKLALETRKSSPSP